MRALLPLITAAVLTHGYHFRRQLKVQRKPNQATRLPQEPAELDDWLKPYAGADEFGGFLRQACGASYNPCSLVALLCEGCSSCYEGEQGPHGSR